MNRHKVQHDASENRICNSWNGYAHDERGDYICPGWPHNVTDIETWEE